MAFIKTARLMKYVGISYVLLSDPYEAYTYSLI
jgi:hypothetical protein